MTAQGTLRRGQAHRAVWTRGQYEQGAKGRPPQAGRASVARALRSDLSRSAEGAVGAKQSPGRHHRACGPSVEGSGGLTGRMVRGQPAARELVPVVLEEWQSAAVLSRVPWQPRPVVSQGGGSGRSPRPQLVTANFLDTRE